MAILSKLSKKSSIPDELPDLAIDELKKELAQESQSITKEENTEEESTEETEEENTEEESTEETEEETIKKPSKTTLINENQIEESFFNEILGDIESESKSLEEIKEFATNTNIVKDMKKYWEKQNDKIILKALTKKFKEEINTKVGELKKLEFEWRKIYTDLIEKEEEIKKGEIELKKIIQELVEVHKAEKKSPTTKKVITNEKEKTTKKKTNNKK